MLPIEILVIVLCGVGTFLLRLLPIWRARRQTGRHDGSAPRPPGRKVGLFLQGIGPAALTALLLVSIWPFATEISSITRPLSAAVALAVIYLAKRLTRGLAGPTLLGAAVYGLLMHLLH